MQRGHLGENRKILLCFQKLHTKECLMQQQWMDWKGMQSHIVKLAA